MTSGNRRAILEDLSGFWLEFVLGVVLLLLAVLLPKIGVPSETAWFAGVLSVLLPLSIAIQKIHTARALKALIEAAFDGPSTGVTLLTRLTNLPEPHALHARDALREAAVRISSIEQGIVPLTETQYFDRVIDETEALGPDQGALAVNSFAESRWLKDPKQLRFFDENKRAIARGCEICRVFIVDGEDHTTNAEERNYVIQCHINAGVRVLVVRRKLLRGNPDLMKDWILFDTEKPRAYVDYQDPVDPTRVERGELLLDPAMHSRLMQRYRYLQRRSLDPSELEVFLEP